MSFKLIRLNSIFNRSQYPTDEITIENKFDFARAYD